MAREIPEVVRAAAGLAATVLDEARKLPETLPGIPVRLIGMALQQAMKVQQQYAGLVARGDELFTGLRGENEPGLATFDDDEDVDPVPSTPPSTGYRESAFDRAGDTLAHDEALTDDEARTLPADPPADAVTSVVDELAEQVETGRRSIEDLADEAPAIEEILDEIAIDELVDRAPTPDQTSPEAPDLSPVQDAPATEDADALGSALLESDDFAAATAPAGREGTSDVATGVDVLTPDGEVATVDAAVTDEGIAAPEAPTPEDATATEAPTQGAKGRKATQPRKAAEATGRSKAGKGAKAERPTDTAATDTNAGPATATATATATDESGSDVAAATGVRTDVGATDTAAEDGAIAEGAAVGAVGETSGAPTDDPQGESELSGSQAAGAAPVDGYDSFSIAQLRGRLRGYALSTVHDLLAYEEATRAREPYLRLLRNRLEKLEQQVVESSPLAPRGV